MLAFCFIKLRPNKLQQFICIVSYKFHKNYMTNLLFTLSFILSRNIHHTYMCICVYAYTIHKFISNWRTHRLYRCNYIIIIRMQLHLYIVYVLQLDIKPCIVYVCTRIHVRVTCVSTQNECYGK